MKEEKVIIIGDPLVGVNEQLAKLVADGKAEIITLAQAKERGITALSSKPAYEIKPYPIIDVPEWFTPPLTRAQRRKQSRKK